MTEGKEVTLLPSFSDALDALNRTFAANGANGISFTNVNSYTSDLKSVAAFTMTPSRCTIEKSPQGQPVPVLHKSRFFSASLIANILDRASATLQYSGEMVDFSASGWVSPFLLASGRARTDGKSVAAQARISARQPFSHIDADLDFLKRGIVGMSALFGTSSEMAGIRVKFDGRADKPTAFQGFVGLDWQSWLSAVSIKKGKMWKGTIWITQKPFDGCVAGVKIDCNEMKQVNARCAFNAEIGKCTVRGGLGLDGVVNSEISGKITDAVTCTVSTMLNHRTRDYTLGFDLMLETSPFE